MLNDLRTITGKLPNSSTSSCTDYFYDGCQSRCSPVQCRPCCVNSMINDHTYSVLKRICRKIIKDYNRQQYREKYTIFEGGNSINVRIHRSCSKSLGSSESNVISGSKPYKQKPWTSSGIGRLQECGKGGKKPESLKGYVKDKKPKECASEDGVKHEKGKPGKVKRPKAISDDDENSSKKDSGKSLGSKDKGKKHLSGKGGGGGGNDDDVSGGRGGKGGKGKTSKEDGKKGKKEKRYDDDDDDKTAGKHGKPDKGKSKGKGHKKHDDDDDDDDRKTAGKHGKPEKVKPKGKGHKKNDDDDDDDSSAKKHSKSKGKGHKKDGEDEDDTSVKKHGKSDKDKSKGKGHKKKGDDDDDGKTSGKSGKHGKDKHEDSDDNDKNTGKHISKSKSHGKGKKDLSDSDDGIKEDGKGKDKGLPVITDLRDKVAHGKPVRPEKSANVVKATLGEEIGTPGKLKDVPESGRGSGSWTGYHKNGEGEKTEKGSKGKGKATGREKDSDTVAGESDKGGGKHGKGKDGKVKLVGKGSIIVGALSKPREHKAKVTTDKVKGGRGSGTGISAGNKGKGVKPGHGTGSKGKGVSKGSSSKVGKKSHAKESKNIHKEKPGKLGKVRSRYSRSSRFKYMRPSRCDQIKTCDILRAHMEQRELCEMSRCPLTPHLCQCSDVFYPMYNADDCVC